MNSFDQILKRLLEKGKSISFAVKGQQPKSLKALALFTSKNMVGSTYYKGVLADHSIFILIPEAKEIYYAKKPLGMADGISDDMIGQEELDFNGKSYGLVNKDDYQFTLQLIVGTPFDIEGECRFSDYSPKDGSNELLSLGWITYTGKRADVLAELIEPENIEIQ